MSLQKPLSKAQRLVTGPLLAPCAICVPCYLLLGQRSATRPGLTVQCHRPAPPVRPWVSLCSAVGPRGLRCSCSSWLQWHWVRGFGHTSINGLRVWETGLCGNPYFVRACRCGRFRWVVFGRVAEHFCFYGRSNRSWRGLVDHSHSRDLKTPS